jgi:hypothetical protein
MGAGLPMASTGDANMDLPPLSARPYTGNAEAVGFPQA